MDKIILAQLVAHLVADFFAQPESMSDKKREKGSGSWHLYTHILIVFTASLLMTLTVKFIFYALAITAIHFIIYLFKSYIERTMKTNFNHYLLFIDQLLHVVAIFVAVAIYSTNNNPIPAYLDFFTMNQLLIFSGLLICMKPANVIIRSCLSSLHLYDMMEIESELQRAGRWIGTVERVMALALVMLQQYTAIGFIIAAKSILRYNENKTGKTEYVLIGTLLSFSIPLLIGIGISEGLFESFFTIQAGIRKLPEGTMK